MLFPWQLIHLQGHQKTSKCRSTSPTGVFHARAYFGWTGWVTHNCKARTVRAPTLSLRTCWLPFPSASISVSLECVHARTHTRRRPGCVSPHVISRHCGISHRCETTRFFQIDLLHTLPAKTGFRSLPCTAQLHLVTVENMISKSSLAGLLLGYTCFGIGGFLLSSCSYCIILEENTFGSFIFLVR